MKKPKYVEPADYFPASLRKEFGLGEYAEDTEEEEKRAKENKDFRDYVNKKK